MSSVQCPFCEGVGETAMGGACANCGGRGTTTQEALDAVAHPTRGGASPKTDDRIETSDGPEKEMKTYRVSIKELSDQAHVDSTGDLTGDVVYAIAANSGSAIEDWNGGTVAGETLKRCLRIREMGEIVVSEPSDWKDHRPDRWQEIIVNLALDHSSSESA